MWCPFFSIRYLILFLKLPTEARCVTWGILAHSLRSDVLNTSTLVWAIQETFAFNIDHTENLLDSNQAMKEATSAYFKILENDIWQSWDFIEVWDGAPFCWNVKWWSLKCFSFLQKLEQNIFNFEVCFDVNPLFNENQRWVPRFGDCYTHHEWKRLFFSGRLFSRTHQWLLNNN